MKGNEDNIYISIYIGKIIFVFFPQLTIGWGGGGYRFWGYGHNQFSPYILVTINLVPIIFNL